MLENCEVKRPFKNNERKMGDIIKIDLGIGSQGMDCIHLAEDRVQLWASTCRPVSL